MAVFGKVLRAAMDKNEVQNHEMATALGKTDAAISHLLSGRTKSVDVATSEIISQVLETPREFWSDLKSAEKAGTAMSAAYYFQKLGLSGDTGILPGILVDHQVIHLLNTWNSVAEEDYSNGTLILTPFAEERMGPASYDTRVGGVWSGSPRKSRPISVSSTSPFVLKKGETKYVHSLEHFRMPIDIVGRVGPTVDLITRGVDVAHGPLIAPLFEGKLTVRIKNQTEEDLELTPEFRFIKVVFEKLQAVPDTKKRTFGLAKR